MKKANKKQGFTLVEIMIVVAIIGLLAAIGIPSFQKARNNARTSSCINNLRLIDSAKQQIAMTDNLSDTETPADADVWEYMKNQVIPVCPAAGAYTVGSLLTPPACSAFDATTHNAVFL